MREVWKTAASLSLSGSLVILALLPLRLLLRGRVSQRWQYYVWLIAVFRLLLPLSPGNSPVGSLFQAEEVLPAVSFAEPYGTAPSETEGAPAPVSPPRPESSAASQPDPEPAGIRLPEGETVLDRKSVV